MTLKSVVAAARRAFVGSRESAKAHAERAAGLLDLERALAATTAGDVQLRRSWLRSNNSGGAVGYQHMHTEPGAFDVVVFLLPPGSSFPLHDHPGMLVLSQLLVGDLRIRSFDWIGEAGAGAGGARAARRRPDVAVEAPLLERLLPDEGNVHALSTSSGAAFLDVLSPPYDDRGARPCTYYAEERAAGGNGLLALLTPTDVRLLDPRFSCVAVAPEGTDQ